MLAAYRSFATSTHTAPNKHDDGTEPDASVSADDMKANAAMLGKLGEAKPARMTAAALRADKARVIAGSSALEIQERTAAAGMSTAEQLEWVLDKPGVHRRWFAR